MLLALVAVVPLLGNPLPDGAIPQSPSNVVMVRDMFQYPVGIIRHRWRCDYQLTTMVHGRDTLCFQVTNSELQDVIATTVLPETATVNVDVSVLRFEQDQHGRLLSGPRVERNCNVDRLNMLDVLHHEKAPNPPTLPRRIRQRPITSTGTPDVVSDMQVVQLGHHRVAIEWPRYTAVLYGDTLTSGLLGSEQYEAIKQLGYSENDTYDLWVTIERYIVAQDTGRTLAGPNVLGPMPKQQFDRRRVIFTKAPPHVPQPLR